MSNARTLANLVPDGLDDYEEGTWTPTFTATGYTFTYSDQAGQYTKVGNLVVVKCYFGATYASGSGTVAGFISGLPFTSSANNANFGAGSIFPDTGSAFFQKTAAIRSEPSSTLLRIGDGFGGSASTLTFNWAAMGGIEFEISVQYFTS